MSFGVRFACACAFLVMLPIQPLAAAELGSLVDSNVTTVDTVSGNPAADAGPGTPETLGVAVVSCRLGARLAAGSPSTLGGVGLAVCLTGIWFEIEDFLHL